MASLYLILGFPHMQNPPLIPAATYLLLLTYSGLASLCHNLAFLKPEIKRVQEGF